MKLLVVAVPCSVCFVNQITSTVNHRVSTECYCLVKKRNQRGRTSLDTPLPGHPSAHLFLRLISGQWLLQHVWKRTFITVDLRTVLSIRHINAGAEITIVPPAFISPTLCPDTHPLSWPSLCPVDILRVTLFRCVSARKRFVSRGRHGSRYCACRELISVSALSLDPTTATPSQVTADTLAAIQFMHTLNPPFP